MKELRAVLADTRITSPSLRLDPVGLAREPHRTPVASGGCPVGVAAPLAAALRAQRATGL